MASTLQICALFKPWATIPVSSRLHGSQQENKKWTERHGCVTSGTFRHQWKASRLGYWIKAVFASNAWFSIILELWKMNPLTWHERGTKKISESPTGIETMTSRTHGGRSLSYENSWWARLFHWVPMWQASCILLGLALSNSSWAVIGECRWWILSSVIKCEGWIIQHDTNLQTSLSMLLSIFLGFGIVLK